MKPEAYRYAVELGKAAFSKAPKRFDAIYVAMAVTGKLAAAVVHPEMPGIADIDQAVAASPAIAVDGASNRHFTENNGL